MKTLAWYFEAGTGARRGRAVRSKPRIGSARGRARLIGGYTITLADYTGLLLFPLFALLGAAFAW